jgi:flagellar biogenesis protein FliO
MEAYLLALAYLGAEICVAVLFLAALVLIIIWIVRKVRRKPDAEE